MKQKHTRNLTIHAALTGYFLNKNLILVTRNDSMPSLTDISRFI